MVDTICQKATPVIDDLAITGSSAYIRRALVRGRTKITAFKGENGNSHMHLSLGNSIFCGPILISGEGDISIKAQDANFQGEITITPAKEQTAFGCQFFAQNATLCRPLTAKNSQIDFGEATLKAPTALYNCRATASGKANLDFGLMGLRLGAGSYFHTGQAFVSGHIKIETGAVLACGSGALSGQWLLDGGAIVGCPVPSGSSLTLSVASPSGAQNLHIGRGISLSILPSGCLDIWGTFFYDSAIAIENNGAGIFAEKIRLGPAVKSLPPGFFKLQQYGSCQIENNTCLTTAEILKAFCPTLGACLHIKKNSQKYSYMGKLSAKGQIIFEPLA